MSQFCFICTEHELKKKQKTKQSEKGCQGNENMKYSHSKICYNQLMKTLMKIPWFE